MTAQLPSKVRLAQIASFSKSMALPPSHDEIEAMARSLLAAHEQEPVAWMLNDPEFNHSVATKAGHTLEFYRSKGWGIEPLFTHPEPVHAVPGEMTIKQAARDYFGGFGSYMAYRDGFNACRAFMLNGGKS
ncbi:hypothetical protein PHDIMM138B_07265 [Phytobacter diazotrophicus]